MHSLFPLIFLLWTFFAFPLIAAHTPCNGHIEFCDRKYSNISQMGAHDSAFVGVLPSDNQHVSVTEQLNAGIRFLQSQTHLNAFGALSMCHTSCFLADAGSVEGYLATIKTWLDGHPHQVVTVLLTNGDNVATDMFDNAFTSSGIKPYAFVPSTNPDPLPMDAWPTLGELIAANTRLVTFIDTIPSPLPHILPEFECFFETPFDTTAPSFPQCTLDRPAASSPDGKMYIMNHFLDRTLFGDIMIPDVLAVDTTNAAEGEGSIGGQVALCEGLYGRKPGVVLVDWLDRGDVKRAGEGMNGF